MSIHYGYPNWASTGDWTTSVWTQPATTTTISASTWTTDMTAFTVEPSTWNVVNQNIGPGLSVDAIEQLRASIKEEILREMFEEDTALPAMRGIRFRDDN